MPKRGKKRWTTVSLLGVVLLLSWWVAERDGTRVATDGIEELYASSRSGEVVESEGVVSKVLRDDLEGSRHQRFVVLLSSGHTVLISHNIDLAPRVEGLAVGDPVVFRGQYEWNDKGGVVHWTHHDPDGDRPGGWILHDGNEYR